MKIAILSFDHIDPGLPLARYLSTKENTEIDLYLIFSQKYKTASVLSFEDIEVDNGLLSEGMTGKILGKEINGYLKCEVRCRIFVFNNASIYDPRNLVLARRFALHLKKEKYEVIHFNGTSGFLLYLHLFLRNIPRVNTVHDPVPHSGEESWFLTFLYGIIFKLRIEFILHSRYLADLFVRKYKVNPKRVHTIYYGAYEIYKFLTTGPREEMGNMILFFGRISPYKGIEYLIEAAKIVRKSIPDLKVVIAGKGGFHFETRPLGGDKTFEVINRYIPNKELTDLIQESSLVVLPYTDATQSGVAMTAYAFNKPVVASRVGGLPEVIEHNRTGKLVPPKNPEALAEAIADLLANREKLRRMSQNIKNKCQAGDLSWQEIATRTINVYEKAVNRQRGRRHQLGPGGS
jgi:glycosyltransferase involved in cell wall biosynthesis